MIASIKRLADFISIRSRAKASRGQDDVPEFGILQFGDGMGLTSMTTYPCSEPAKPDMETTVIL